MRKKAYCSPDRFAKIFWQRFFFPPGGSSVFENQSPAHEWLDHIAEQVRSMGCEPVRISNIDTNAEAAALVQANVRIAHARKSVAPPPLQGSPQALAMHDTPLLGDGAEHAPAAAEDNAPRPGYRECPSCAEWIREKARVCRFCQSELQTPESA